MRVAVTVNGGEVAAEVDGPVRVPHAGDGDGGDVAIVRAVAAAAEMREDAR